MKHARLSMTHIIVISLLVASGCQSDKNEKNLSTADSSFSKDEVVAQADSYLKENKVREAEILLSRASQQYPSDFTIQSRLFGINVSQTKSSLQKSDVVKAGESYEAAETALTAMRLIGIDPTASVPRDFAVTIKASEDEAKGLRGDIKIKVNLSCRTHLSEADSLAKQAKVMIGRNDRTVIIDGLTKVRMCSLQSKWLSTELKGQAHQQIEALLMLATPGERDSLLRSAGYGFEQ